MKLTNEMIERITNIPKTRVAKTEDGSVMPGSGITTRPSVAYVEETGEIIDVPAETWLAPAGRAGFDGRLGFAYSSRYAPRIGTLVFRS